jgi:CheY-like chemotaxis protein
MKRFAGHGSFRWNTNSKASAHRASNSFAFAPKPQRSSIPFPYVREWPVTLPQADLPPPTLLRTLVVDDDTDSREALEILLSWAGYEVLTANNGADGLSIAKTFSPEIIFLDIGMPDMSGYEVCRTLRASIAFCDTRIYALSGFSGADHDTRCSEAGFTGQLTKPLDLTVIQSLL